MNNLESIERELNPFPIYQKMRQEQPVYYNPRRGSWSVFGFDDVQRVLSDYETFSSQFAGGGQDGGSPFAASMISSDPPRHRQLRTLVTQAFTPRAVDALAPRIRSIVTGLLDKVSAAGGTAGQMDVISDLGTPLPVTVIAELLGIPVADREKFKSWSDLVVSMANFGDEVDYAKFQSDAVMEMSAYFFNMIQQRQAEPGEDLISGLLAAEIEGQRLETIELLGFCVLLLVAGNETTTNLIGNAMLAFAEHPEAWERLRAEPGLLPGAIEEVLRYRSPVQSMFRVTKKEARLGDKTIPAGTSLLAWIGSANHDEAQFPDAERFDIERTPNRHLAFGQGIHYCLGAPLARLEGRIALGAMLERFRCFDLAPGAKLERVPSLIVYGVKQLPIHYQST
ncbi:MAG TPA: cytochrome P450 [Anaerolineales bacterium]